MVSVLLILCNNMIINFLIEDIIPLSLKSLGLDSKDARNLLIGTCLQESLNGQYSRQIGGPALGIYQMEPNTHRDIWENFLIYRPKYSRIIKQMIPNDQVSTIPNNDHLIYNPIYATQLCRIHYFRVKEPLPDTNNVQKLANYWKKYYNTMKGKGKVSEFIEKFETFLLKYN